MIIVNSLRCQGKSISSSKSNIALVCVRFLKVNLTLLCLSKCSVKANIVGLVRVLKFGFMTAISVSFVDRSKLGNIVNKSCYLKKQVSLLSFSAIYLQSYHGRYAYLQFSLENRCAVMFYTRNQDDPVVF